MKGYRKGPHTVYSLHYHFVFLPKYRKPVLRGDVGRRLRDLIREICRTHEIEILKGHIRDRARSGPSAPRTDGNAPARAVPGRAGEAPVWGIGGGLRRSRRWIQAGARFA